MRLSDRDIIEALMASAIQITPEPDYDEISGVSIDLHLSNRFRYFGGGRTTVIDTRCPAKAIDAAMSSEIEVDEFCILPGRLILGATQETISLPDDLVGWLDGRSSLARLGLMVHVTAHRIDPGWRDGQIVLELFNAGPLPILLHSGMSIAAISFEQMTSPALRPYHKRETAKYRNQHGPVASRIEGSEVWPELIDESAPT